MADKAKTIFYMMMMFLCIALIPLWIWLIAPELKKIPNNFFYTAELLSIDNFYDEKLQQYEGEHISKTKFIYEVQEVKPNYLIISNIFDVRKLSGIPIFSVKRIYTINPYTGEHISDTLERNRQGYLFGPRYANKKDFNYWHVNYDTKALLKFVNKEKIEGLTVYHYEARYTADQTKNLSYLPRVPKERGITTDVVLQLWIEPISGWLVKYQDNTVAYYYDIKTGEKLFPWNNFSNQYAQISIERQVKNATFLKWKILGIDFFVPTICFLFAMSFLFLAYHPNFLTKWDAGLTFKTLNNLIPSFVYLLLFSISIGYIYYFLIYKTYTHVYTIGISTWYDNPELLSAVAGFKDGLMEYGFVEGRNIKYIIKNPHANVNHQVRIIQSFVEKKVNLIFTLTTPGTIIAKGGTTEMPIVFTDVAYPLESGIVDLVKYTKSRLTGTRNYISPAVQFYYFNLIFPKINHIGYLYHQGDPDSEIMFEEYKLMLKKRNIDLQRIAIIDLNDLNTKLREQKKYQALFVACDLLSQIGGGKIIADYAIKNKIPTFSCNKGNVLNGILISYYADLYTLGKMAGKKAALILRGAEPGWLRTDAPDRGYLIINLNTASLLGVIISPDILKKADKLIIDYSGDKNEH